MGEHPQLVLVIAKEPRPGRVKTRLQSRFPPHVAAELAAAALQDTIAAVRASGADCTVVLDGAPGPYLPPDTEVLTQRGAGLDERIAAAFDDAFSRRLIDLPAPDGPILLIGMDTPQVDADLLRGIDFTGADAVLGLAADGGFWALGLREPHPEALLGVPMSTAGTGAEQLRRLRAAGLRVTLLPTMVDVDTPVEAEQVAAGAPLTRFAATHRRAVADLAADAVGGAVAPRRVAALGLFEEALAGGIVHVEFATTRRLLDAARWSGGTDTADRLMLDRCQGPVLDLGCGPGRLVGELARRGVPALGVDVSAAAVALTRRRGAVALRRDLHEKLPGEGRWRTVLLADGNIGIGGRPAVLLHRVSELLADDGLLLVDVEDAPDLDESGELALRSADGSRWARMPWARLGARALAAHANPLGLHAEELWEVGGRVVVALRRRARGAAAVAS
ncbi:MAG: DUF2064 domain-containing protein [Janthinobacterium lividum]